MNPWQRARALVILLVMVGGIFAIARTLAWMNHDATPVVATAPALRTKLSRIVRLSGDVQGGRRSIVACELENLPDPDGRPSMGGMTILELVEDGARVKKGDPLCRFDASRYEELERRQRIEVQRAEAEERQANLELEVARVALKSFQDGEVTQTIEQLQAALALTRADLKRAEERLEWSSRMAGIGYVSADEHARDRVAVARLRNQRDETRTQLRNYQAFTVPRTTRELEVRVENAQRRAEFGKDQREREQSRLDKIESLIEKCVLRAPHDGMVIYHDQVFASFRPNEDLTLRPGKQVYQNQPLFMLPDLNHPVVQVTLHEADVGRVRKGMAARVTIPAIGVEHAPGTITAIDPIPTAHWRSWTEYQAVRLIVKLDDVPPGLVPELTAHVEVLAEERPNALVVPGMAIAIEEGEPVCYVEQTSGEFERRPVRIAQADSDRVEVLEGLQEGERVALDPRALHPEPELQIDPFPKGPVPSASTIKVTSTTGGPHGAQTRSSP